MKDTIEADVSRKKRKDVIDKQAAVIILQSWLDRQAFLRKAEEEKAATEAEADDGEEE